MKLAQSEIKNIKLKTFQNGQNLQMKKSVGNTLSLLKRLAVTSDNHLSVDNLDLVDLCNEYGTPLYVFDECSIRENYRRFRDSFEKHYPKVNIAYSIKTNNNIAICKILQEEGACAEVGSGLDLYIARKAGFSPDHIIFDGLFKPETVLREAVSHEVLIINVESFEELELLNIIAGELGKKQNIGIRVSPPSIGALNTENLYCNPQARFGFPYEDVLSTFRRALEMENLKVKGVMTHPYWGIHWFLPLVKKIQAQLGIKLQFVNLGGGFVKSGTKKIGTMDLIKDYLRRKIGLRSTLDLPPKKKIREIEKSARLVGDEVRQILGDEEATIVFEPGRYIIHDAGILLLRTGLVKRASGFDWVIVDGGVNLNSDYLERKEIKLLNRANAPYDDVINVVGPLLFSRDFVTIKQRLPKPQVGDILGVFKSGAYTLSNSTQFLNPRPSAVLIRTNGKALEIRAKETFEDVVRSDKYKFLKQDA